jgi:hypothetical protein
MILSNSQNTSQFGYVQRIWINIKNEFKFIAIYVSVPVQLTDEQRHYTDISVPVLLTDEQRHYTDVSVPVLLTDEQRHYTDVSR